MKKKDIYSISRPKISVIIATHNSGTGLGACLDSVLVQPVKELEVIVVDVLSTDNTREIIEDTAEFDERVIYLTDGLGSIGYAKDQAIARARAPYIVIVEPEEYLEGSVLLHLYEEMEENPQYDMYIAEMDAMGSSAKGSTNQDKKREYKEANRIDGRKLDNDSRFFRWFLFDCTAIYRKSFLMSSGIRHFGEPGCGKQRIAFRYQMLMKANAAISMQILSTIDTDCHAELVDDPKAVTDVCNEYRYLEKKIKAEPKEWWKTRYTFWQSYFRSNLEYYSRLTDELKPVLSKRMQGDIKMAIQRGDFSEAHFDVMTKDLMELLIKSPKRFDDEMRRGVEN